MARASVLGRAGGVGDGSGGGDGDGAGGAGPGGGSALPDVSDGSGPRCDRFAFFATAQRRCKGSVACHVHAPHVKVVPLLNAHAEQHSAALDGAAR